MATRTPCILWCLALTACTALPSSLESPSRPVVAHCDGEFVDAGVVRLGRLVHLSTRHGEQSVTPVDGTRMLPAADGGFCVSLDVAGEVELCLDSGRCSRVAVEVLPLDTVRALAFGLVPIGKTSIQTFIVTNRLSDRIVVSARSDASEFGVSPVNFTVDARRSRTVSAAFLPQSSGEKRGTVTLDDGEQEYTIEMNGAGGGPILVVQQFLDAGFVTQMAPRMRERRRLEIQNQSAPGSDVHRSASVEARTTSCSAGTPPRLSVAEGVVVGPGERAWLDLLIEPTDYETSRVCGAEVKLGPVWYPFGLSYMGIIRAPLNLGYPSVFPPDGGLMIDMYHDWLEPVWLSWPRLEFRDAGLELVSSWSEYYLPPRRALTVFVRQTRPAVELPNAVLVDGNVPGGTARFPIERQ